MSNERWGRLKAVTVVESKDAFSAVSTLAAIESRGPTAKVIVWIVRVQERGKGRMEGFDDDACDQPS